MEGEESSSPNSQGIQVTTPTSSQPLASAPTRRTIHDYFAPSSSITRQNSSFEEIPTSSQANDASGTPPKRLKLTADNGHAIMIRQPGRKKARKVEILDISMGDEKVGRASHSRRPHSRGKLTMLPSFPLDVIFEIFAHLLPIDLLHLIRATKDIRALLLHRSASYVWKRALANVPDLPQCPNDVPLPQWASLVFDTFCQNCLASNVKSLNFNLRVRYCNKCVKIKLLADSFFNVKKNPQDNLILKGIPFSRWNERAETYCTIADKDIFLEEYKTHRDNPTLFMKERIDKLKLRAEHARKCKAWYEAILDRRSAELDEIRETRAELISAKLTNAGFAKELNFLALFENGVCAIRPWPSIIHFDDHPHVKVARPLTEKAWERIEPDMLDYMQGITIQMQRDERARLLRRRSLAVHTAYVNWRGQPENLQAHPPDKLMPSPADLLQAGDVKRFVENPGDGEYDRKDVLTVMRTSYPYFSVDDFVVNFRRGRIVGLFMEADYDDVGNRRFSSSDDWPKLKRPHESYWSSDYVNKEEALKSAVFVFRCKSDIHRVYLYRRVQEQGNDHREAECLWYPDFFFHPCTSMQDIPWDEYRSDDKKHLSMEKQFPGCRRTPWVAGRLKFDEKASRTVKNLLEAAGLEPTTTVKKLDELNHRFVCLKCTFGARCDGSRKVRVWSWREAVEHCLRMHFGDSRVTWECLYPEDTQQALALQAAEHTKRGYPPADACAMWKCMRCRDTSSDSGRMTMAELRAHFLQRPKHGDVNKIDEGENILYYKARDYTPKELAPVKMIPEAHEPMAKWKRPLTGYEKALRWMMKGTGLYSDEELE